MTEPNPTYRPGPEAVREGSINKLLILAGQYLEGLPNRGGVIGSFVEANIEAFISALEYVRKTKAHFIQRPEQPGAAWVINYRRDTIPSTLEFNPINMRFPYSGRSVLDGIITPFDAGDAEEAAMRLFPSLSAIDAYAEKGEMDINTISSFGSRIQGRGG